MYTRRELSQTQKDQARVIGVRESIWIPLPNSGPVQYFKPRSLHDLKGYTPTRLEFTHPHPDNGYFRTVWFEMLFHGLYARVEDFAKDNFGQGDLSVAYSGSPWVEGSSPVFVNYASKIARKDDRVGGWDGCLQNAVERQYLVMGVVAKVLDTKVFSELLFGADPKVKAFLAGFDELKIQEEGSLPRCPLPEDRH